MTWLTKDLYGNEHIFRKKPKRGLHYWFVPLCSDCSIELPKGCIKKLIGKDITWEDEPVKLTKKLL